jgi:hypothetical protein
MVNLDGMVSTMGVMIQKVKDTDICIMKIVQTSRIGVRSKINGQEKQHPQSFFSDLGNLRV